MRITHDFGTYYNNYSFNIRVSYYSLDRTIKEVETDLQDYREGNPLVEQLSERIKELETDLKLRDNHEEQPAK